ncbi:tripartite tricarboxylate transporter substrate binding protein [Rhodovarius crocodyli]|uniref:Tripartite tricarboxylate transporter substrate binding protein n=1 Tax=Rhodovarius crocodyli TaxID=1979269 RepID=A0A437LZ56_9PROT|nr:tripartite tricarboxylate transporter substrate binding protein [Rhodovarius crocodyli]RVT90603.1 tripartite tricarboxylate transporter substrate binding protein [Rhodovarius crocodyli]
MKRRLFIGAGLALPMVARAQGSYPERAIRLVVPFPPGGGTDTISREVAGQMQAIANWTVVPENRPGAGGNIGLDAVAKAAPDGYTIGMGQTSNLAINPTLYPNMPFHPTRDLAFVSLIAAQPLVLVVGKQAPWRDMPALLAAIRAAREPLTAGHPGNGTVGHLCGELLSRRLGAEITQVPYRGASAIVTDLLAGRVDMYIGTPSTVRGLVAGGELRALAVTSGERSPFLPEVPTIREAGVEGVVAENWTGIVAPARTPAEVVRRWNAELNRALAGEEMRAKLAQDVSVPRGSTSDEFRAFVEQETEKWGRIVREARIQLT